MKLGTFICSLLALFLCVASQAQQLDSLKRAALDAKLAEYVLAIEREGVEVQQQECDFLIGSCTDSLVRQYVALNLYDYYLTSKVMGSESVAIHLLDNWFFNGKVKMPYEPDLINARVYADFNRQSLIGLKAPSLEMKTMQGEPYDVFASATGRYGILYFYDTGCARCKVETVRLCELLEKEDYPVSLYAVYAGDNKEAWSRYVSERFGSVSDDTNLIHLYDPELDSDFQRKYAVLQTPRMYLVDPEGVIIGRGLDVDALYQMLQSIFAEKKLDYGSDESIALFDMALGDSPTIEQIDGFAENIERLTIAAGDTLMYRQLVGDFMYYLSARSGEVGMEGLAHLIDGHILTRNDVWKTEDDSLKVIGFAQIMDDLLSKAEPGTRIADIKVRGELTARGKSKAVNRRLTRLRGKENVVIFHTEGCHVCEAEMAAASEMMKSNPAVRVLAVNVDEVMTSSPSIAARLFDAFDLTVLPYIIITDRKGTILRRYVSLQ